MENHTEKPEGPSSR